LFGDTWRWRKVGEAADVVVVGGGILGCAVSYNLARLKVGKVVLLERRFLTSGATGRCGAGFRQQWGTEINCMLARASVRIMSQLGEELDCPDLEFRQSGYLMLCYTDAQAQQLRANVELQNQLGIPSRMIGPEEARKIVPFLNIRGVKAASFCHEDGHVNPFKLTYAYARAARRLGVDIRQYTPVTALMVERGRVQGVKTPQGPIFAPIVVNAAGAWVSSIARTAGLEHPVEPERHQILVTEPVAPTMGPMVLSFHHSSYCQQVPNGGFLMGYGNPWEPKGFNESSGWQFLEEMAAKITELFPLLGEVRVVRQWAGLYDVSPDGQPIIGPVPELEGYYLAVGCAKGLMLGPILGRLAAECVTGQPFSLPLVEQLSVDRFRLGMLIPEPAVV
jgi:sarcosine oxidase subunit beta